MYPHALACPYIEDSDIRSLISAFFETFDGSARADLARFIERFPETKTWLIAADYVVGDKGRPNDVFAFSLLPYAEELNALRSRLAVGLPRDIKATRHFTPSASRTLRAPYVFHVPVVLPKDRLLLGPTGARSVANGRNAVAALVHDAVEMKRGDEVVKAMKRLERAAGARGYNHRLLGDVFLLAAMFAALTNAVLRERSGARTVWMSDRDSMTGWCGSALWHFAQLNVRGMAEIMGIDHGAEGPGVCVPSADGAMWFDEMVRLPDHMAGGLAAWDMVEEAPAPTSRRELVSDMLRDVFAEADNVAVIRLRADRDGFSWSRVVFGRRGTPTGSAIDLGAGECVCSVSFTSKRPHGRANGLDQLHREPLEPLARNGQCRPNDAIVAHEPLHVCDPVRARVCTEQAVPVPTDAPAPFDNSSRSDHIRKRRCGLTVHARTERSSAFARSQRGHG